MTDFCPGCGMYKAFLQCHCRDREADPRDEFEAALMEDAANHGMHYAPGEIAEHRTTDGKYHSRHQTLNAALFGWKLARGIE